MRIVTAFVIVLASLLASCGPSADEYSAYPGAGGPQCGNNTCRPGDLCADREYQNYAGLCRVVHH